MSEIQIRNAVATDIKTLMAFDHTCMSDYVWQFDLQQGSEQMGVVFREIRLPRSILIRYPKPLTHMVDDWNRQSGMMVAIVDQQICGYLRLTDHIIPETAWITDLVVEQKYRTKGVGKRLIISAQSWAVERQNSRIIIEISAKNNPGIHLAKKMGMDFCGYNDNYYATNDVALFFGRVLRS
jgi:GNAT superfamily N-acetyltransferase